MIDKLYVTMGISGSGKSLFAEELGLGDECVEMDAIRKLVCGSVSDQSKNSEVCKLETARLEELSGDIKKHDVVVSDTNLSFDSLIRILNACQANRNILVVCLDSMKPLQCYLRIKNDLNNGLDRAAVPINAILSQYKKFVTMISNSSVLEFLFDEVSYITQAAGWNKTSDLLLEAIYAGLNFSYMLHYNTDKERDALLSMYVCDVYMKGIVCETNRILLYQDVREVENANSFVFIDQGDCDYLQDRLSFLNRVTDDNRKFLEVLI